MATLHVKTPNGTQYDLDLDMIKASTGSLTTNGYATFPNGCIIQWGFFPNTTTAGWIDITYNIGINTLFWIVGSGIGKPSTSSATDIKTGRIRYKDDTYSSYQILIISGYAAYWIAFGI